MHDAAVGTAFQGGPLVGSDGKVVAISSRNYAPLGFHSEGVYFAIPPKTACEKILRCPSGEPSNPAQGNRGLSRGATESRSPTAAATSTS